jgi:hypothetical protein
MIARRAWLKTALAAAAALALALPAAAAPRKEDVTDPAELNRLYLVVAADTGAANIGAWVGVSGQMLRGAFEGNVPADRLNVVYLDGAQVTRDNVLAQIRALPATPNDAVLFYYGGHGAFDTKSGEHVFALSAGAMYRREVLGALQEKQPGLVVLLSDTCSSEFTFQAGRRPGRVRRPAPAQALSPLFRSLFFRHRSVADITAAQRGSYAWYTPEGGVFTRALCGLLTADAQYPNVTWADFSGALSRDTDTIFQQIKQGATEPPELVNQASQVPLVFSLANPAGPQRVGPARGLKLGAKVAAASGGVKVVEVGAGSPAARLGLEPGDVILSVNGVAAKSLAEYAKLLDAAPQGKARLEIRQAGSGKVVVKDVQLIQAR